MRIEAALSRDTVFTGAKAALICNDKLVVLRRDDIVGIAYPNRIDLPGGGREAGESPAETASRETLEEVGLSIDIERYSWARARTVRPGRDIWLLVAEISEAEADALVLGDEGQATWMMEIAAFLVDPEAIAHMQDGLRLYLEHAKAGG